MAKEKIASLFVLCTGINRFKAYVRYLSQTAIFTNPLFTDKHGIPYGVYDKRLQIEKVFDLF
ncbi:hypothetical protein ACFL60_05825 [Candidatus Omnitrophota bacterium]